MWGRPANLSRRIADASWPPNRHGATTRSSGSGSTAQRRQVTARSPVGSAHRGQAGPSSTSDALHAGHRGGGGAPHAAHCGRKIQSITPPSIPPSIPFNMPRVSTRGAPGCVRTRRGWQVGAETVDCAVVPPRPPVTDPCYVHEPGFIDPRARDEILAWLATLVPLWELRYSTRRPPPPGRQQRPLLRPVYWLGNWQFACLGYYEPPRRTHGVAVAAEPFPPVLARLVARIERRVRDGFPPRVVPRRWRLHTCLVNFYRD